MKLNFSRAKSFPHYVPTHPFVVVDHVGLQAHAMPTPANAPGPKETTQNGDNISPPIPDFPDPTMQQSNVSNGNRLSANVNRPSTNGNHPLANESCPSGNQPPSKNRLAIT